MHVKVVPGLRKLYAEKLLDLTNIGAGAALFGQFFQEKAFSWIITFTGFILIITGYLMSYLLYPRR